MDTAQLHLSDAEWKKILPTDLYLVAREKNTEKPFTGAAWSFLPDINLSEKRTEKNHRTLYNKTLKI